MVGTSDRIKLDKLGNLTLPGSYADYDIICRKNSVEVTDLKETAFGTRVFENVKNLCFDDIGTIPVTSKNPLHVKDVISVGLAGTYSIDTEELLKNDKDLHGYKLKVSHVTDPVGGKVEMNGDKVIFIPDQEFKGVMSFKYHVMNEKGYSNITDIPVYIQTTDLPSDPAFYDQWYLLETKVVNVWPEYTGKGIRVAVVDSGVLPNHPDIAENVVYRDEYDPEISPFQDHALSVAGVIAAARNGKDIVGVAYDADIASITLHFTDVDLTNYDRLERYDVINNSWGGVDFFAHLDSDFEVYSQLYDNLNDSLKESFEYITRYGRNGLGANIVFASGNGSFFGEDSNQDTTKTSPYTVVVGGIEQNHDDIGFEPTYLKFPCAGSNLLVSAPAYNITTLSANNFRFDFNDNRILVDYDTKNVYGTSFAAPIVSGVIALMLEANPNLGWRDVQEILAYSATKCDEENVEWLANSAKNWNNQGLHYSYEYGFGQVDAEAAVRLAKSWSVIQNSDNYKILSLAAPKTFFEFIQEDEYSVSLFKISEDMQIESMKLWLNIISERFHDVEIYLISPDGNRSKILSAPGKNQDLGLLVTESLGEMKWNFFDTNFRAESTKGEWRMEIKGIEGAEKDDYLDIFCGVNVEFYGKDDSYKLQNIFTNEVFDLSNDNRVLNTQNMDTLNFAAMSCPVSINMEEGHVKLKDYVYTVADKNDYNIFIGTDYNDIIRTQPGKNSVIMPGAGDDIVYISSGDTILYPNNADNIGNDVIYGFDPLTCQIFIKNYNLDELNTTHLENGRMIYGEDWSVLLIDC